MNSLPGRLLAFYKTSIGKKWVVALTALALVGFVLAHMIGNLLIYAGPEAINGYAVFLKHFGHGAGIWVARIGLLGAFVLHIVSTVQLVIQNRSARDSRYGVQKSQSSSGASRYMMWSGVVVLVFVVFHVLQFTVHAWNDYGTSEYLAEDGHLDVYKMVITGFSNPFTSAFYIVAIALLSWHLSHGVSSLFQTLGIATEKTAPLFKKLGWAYAALILIGNCSIPLAVLFGILKFPAS